MPNTHRVIKHFRGAGRTHKPGDEVDGREFTQLDKLVSQRYLARIEDVGSGGLTGTGPTPDPKIAQNRAAEKAAGRKAGPATDVAADSPVGDTGDKSANDLAKEQSAPKALRGKLPDDFPGRASLEAAGITTYAQARKRLETLEEIEGVGAATATKIRAEFEGSDETEDANGDAETVGSTSEPGPSTVPKASNA
jgi:hypothetical protein